MNAFTHRHYTCINNIHSLLATHDDTMGGYLLFIFDFLLLQESQCIANIHRAHSRLNMASWRLFNGHTWREGEKNYLVLGTFEDPHFSMKAMDGFADDDYHKKKWRFAVLTLVVINLGGWKLELKVRQGNGIT